METVFFSDEIVEAPYRQRTYSLIPTELEIADILSEFFEGNEDSKIEYVPAQVRITKDL